MNARKITRQHGSTEAGRVVRRDEKPELLEAQRIEELLSRPLDSLKFEHSKPATDLVIINVLENHGVRTVGDLANCTESELLALPRFGKRCLAGVKTELARLGLTLRGSATGSESTAAGRIARRDEKPELLEEQRLEEILSRPIESLKLIGYSKGARSLIFMRLRSPDTSIWIRPEDPKGRPVTTIGELAALKETDLLRRGIGGKPIIRDVLASLGQMMGESAGQRSFAARKETHIKTDNADLRSRPVSSLKLEGLDQYAARRVRGALERRGVATLGDLQSMSERDLRLTKKLGEKSLGIIREEMEALGIPIGGKRAAAKPEPGTAEFERLVSMPVRDLNLRITHGRADTEKKKWEENGITTVGDIIGKKPSELRLKGAERRYMTGRVTIKALEMGLAELGLGLGMAKEMDEHRRVLLLAGEIDDLNLSVRSGNVLKNSGISHCLELVQKPEKEFRKLDISAKGIKDIKEMLGAHGLGLGMEIDQRTMDKVKALVEAQRAVAEHGTENYKPYIRLNEIGKLETNLSTEQLRMAIRLAKKELEELGDDLQPHKIKVIGEFLGLFEGDKKA